MDVRLRETGTPRKLKRVVTYTRKVNTMTKREFLNAVIALENEELSSFATSELAKMDAANVKRQEKAKTPKPEDIEADKVIFNALTTDWQSASEIAEATGYTVSKVSARLRKMDDIIIADGAELGMGKKKVYAIEIA